MASTNKTSNYELSQFLGTDKPAWLSDYNTDMGKIDAQMKLNADSASGADGKADANATAIGTLANLTTDVKTDLVSAINEVDSHADTAQNTAGSANTTAGSALTATQQISAYLNLNTFKSYATTSSVTHTGTGTLSSVSVQVASNVAGTLGKIYGDIIITNATAGQSYTVVIPNTGFDTDESFNVRNGGVITLEQGGSVKNVDGLTYTVGTDGSVTVTGVASTPTVVLRFLACLIFIKNFGD